MATEVIKKLKCMRCGYAWFPRTSDKPRFCAKCNSPSWNLPKRKGKVAA